MPRRARALRLPLDPVQAQGPILRDYRRYAALVNPVSVRGVHGVTGACRCQDRDHDRVPRAASASPPAGASRHVVIPDYRALFAGLPAAFLVMTTDWRVVEANEAYVALLDRSREDLIGRNVFELFPPDPGRTDEHGAHPLQRSFETARDTGRPHAMPLFQYDVADPATGRTVPRYWSLVAAPLLDDDGGTAFVVQRVDDVTDYVEMRQGALPSPDHERQLRERAELIEADLYTRMQQLQEALQAKDVATRRLERLGRVALRLTDARDVADLERIVVGEGLAVLGADGGAILSRAEDGTWRATISMTLGPQVQIDYAWVPYDSVNPGAWTARTGQRLVLPTVADGVAAFGEVMEEVYRITGRRGWVALPLRVRDESLGALVVGWVEEHPLDPDELDLLDTFAAQCAQALDRLQALDAERAAAAAVARMSESLQRSLLSAPPQPPGVEIAVRYSPAARDAEVGGDWYDAFVTPGGVTHLVVGDVSGHDRDAAASMAQLRNVLRGIAYAVSQPPAAVLSWLDRAMHDLQEGVLATAVLAQVDAGTSAGAGGHRRLRWSNAGHPPPLLSGPAGDARLLSGEPELMLGVHPDAHRRDHEIELPLGSTVLMYTDGLVERRTSAVDAGISGLLEHVRDLATLPLEELCDAVLSMPHLVEDDIVLLAFRVVPPG
jgi:PAS domain S-box-containing protein